MAKGTPPRKIAAPVKLPKGTTHSVSIEPIANGFLATHSISGPNTYQTHKVFHKTNPIPMGKMPPGVPPMAPPAAPPIPAPKKSRGGF